MSSRSPRSGSRTRSRARRRSTTQACSTWPVSAAQELGRNGADGTTRQWRQLKYTASTSNLPIASWNEAQLIYAEAVGGQAGLDAINRVRAANSPAIPAFAGPPPAGSAFTELVLEERRRQLFSEGQRYADM